MISRRTFLSLTGACATALLAGCAPATARTHPTRSTRTTLPDGLDLVSADAAADAMIYSFYGRLSVASLERLTDTLFFSPHVCSSRRRRARGGLPKGRLLCQPVSLVSSRKSLT